MPSSVAWKDAHTRCLALGLAPSVAAPKTSWLQAYVAELGIKNLLSEDDSWTCTLCNEAKQGYSDCYRVGVVRHVQEIMIWLSKLMVSVSDGNIACDNLEVCDWATVIRLLLSLHSWEGQGVLAAAWKPAKENIDSCQCTLTLATEHLKLNLLAHFISQQGPQDQQNIPGEDSHGPLWGLQDWNKGEICAEMAEFTSSALSVLVNLEETLCIRQWTKTKSLTYNRLAIFPGGLRVYSKLLMGIF